MGTSLPHATATGWAVTGITACAGLLSLLNGVPEVTVLAVFSGH